MKVSHYSIAGPWPGVCKQYSIMAREAKSNGYSALVYLQRPKWIKDDACWQKIVDSIHLNLPKDYEVK
jgi:hypothetical protein